MHDINTGSVQQNVETICGPDAKWENEDKYECREIDYDITLERSVGKGNSWAVDYKGDFYTGIISTPLIYSFGWQLDEERVEFSVSIAQGVIACSRLGEQTSNSYISMTCSENGGGSLVSSLSLVKELTEETSHNITFFVYKEQNCGYKSMSYNFTVQS